MDLAGKRDVRGARALFERAWALSPQWRFAFNVARTAALDADLVGAERWIWRAATVATSDVERAKTAAERSIIEKQLLAEGFGRLTVRVVAATGTPVVTVDKGPADHRLNVWVVWTQAGRRQVRVDVAGCPGVGRDVLMGERQRLELDCEPCAAVVPPAEDPVRPEVEVVTRPGPETRPEVELMVRKPQAVPQPTARIPSRAPLWVGVAGGVVTLAGAVLMGGAAMGSDADNDSYRAGKIDRTTYSERRASTEGLYAVGAGTGAVGVVAAAIGLWLHLSAAPAPVATAPALLDFATLQRLAPTAQVGPN